MTMVKEADYNFPQEFVREWDERAKDGLIGGEDIASLRDLALKSPSEDDERFLIGLDSVLSLAGRDALTTKLAQDFYSRALRGGIDLSSAIIFSRVGDDRHYFKVSAKGEDVTFADFPWSPAIAGGMWAEDRWPGPVSGLKLFGIGGGVFIGSLRSSGSHGQSEEAEVNPGAHLHATFTSPGWAIGNRLFPAARVQAEGILKKEADGQSVNHGSVAAGPLINLVALYSNDPSMRGAMGSLELYGGALVQGDIASIRGAEASSVSASVVAGVRAFVFIEYRRPVLSRGDLEIGDAVVVGVHYGL